MKPGAVKITARDVVWRAINIIVSALWIVAAAFHFVDGTFQSAMPGIFLLVIGLASIVFEFWRPRMVLENCYFMWNFMGRGIFFLLIGCVALGYRTINYVVSGFSWVFGLLYIILWFTSFTLFPTSSPDYV
ncbi:hypothetical protein LPJ53_002789 [Coemansia erecta]|uniref:COPI associated n=1 Tax=Coemansia erecta TaxID=147472 RepID=A0A9W7Y3H6_9FUNG|nr:hypothetical protein LPJ53_002789 [Coemansia erecta]